MEMSLLLKNILFSPTHIIGPIRYFVRKIPVKHKKAVAFCIAKLLFYIINAG